MERSARPPPPLTWAGLGCSGTDGTLAPQTGSTQLTAPGPGSIYGWPHPLPPVLRNFWKVGNASGGRRGSERRKKKAKDLPQTTLAPAPVPAGALPAPGSYCPLVLLGRGDSPPAPARPWEPGHSWDSAVLEVGKQGLDYRVDGRLQSPALRDRSPHKPALITYSFCPTLPALPQ